MADKECVLPQPPLVGVLRGHDNWVTTIRTTPSSDGTHELLFTTSRDKRLMVWRFDLLGAASKTEYDNDNFGTAVRSLTGHSQPIQDLSMSSNAKYGLTASWDKTVRLWDLETGISLRTFIGHTKDVFSVAISPDNRQIVSGGRDRSILLWNTMAECKFTLSDDAHTDWVSCVRFSPAKDQTLVVSAGWDKVVKVWDLQDSKLKTNLRGHAFALHTVTISPDGSLCASGGKDGVAVLWDVNEGRHLYSLNPVKPINTLCFSPCHYWLCAATDDSIKVWNLENKEVIADIKAPPPSDGATRRPARSRAVPWVTSLAWSTEGDFLFAGRSNGDIHVYSVASPN